MKWMKLAALMMFLILLFASCYQPPTNVRRFEEENDPTWQAEPIILTYALQMDLQESANPEMSLQALSQMSNEEIEDFLQQTLGTTDMYSGDIESTISSWEQVCTALHLEGMPDFEAWWKEIKDQLTPVFEEGWNTMQNAYDAFRTAAANMAESWNNFTARLSSFYEKLMSIFRRPNPNTYAGNIKGSI